MGSGKYPEKTRPNRRTLGKIEAHLTQELQQVKWAEYELQELFIIEGTKSLDSNAIDFVEKGINFVGRTFENNGIQGFIEKREFEPNSPFTITATVIGNYKYVKYQKEEYYCSQNINKLTPRVVINKWNERVAYFFVANIQKFVSLYDGQQGGYKLDDIRRHKIKLPINNNSNLDKLAQIDFDFMENFIAQLEAFRLSQLEAYLLVTGLKDYTLTVAEQQALADFEKGKVVWGEYNLEKLFGKSTRGKRLKSADRIAGDLPFVTAGEAETGVSAFIGNQVEIFKANTTTIDMFGSAKYRNYDYGGDDHIAVVHTENLNKYAAIFMTSAIHKSSYTGKFSYARNFYAKDADELNIQLPTSNQQPDYSFMEILISAVQKLVIKDVVRYADSKIAATKQVING
ncbi:restriction endonuclease subunit S [Glaesserella parasuis]|uniref:restriction endonuclease subunit S n=1 Tax=Glaesserella parasuis TaxID=738 RepID=UPI0024362D6C|nr:restriction endonuclease subunit S [Glaesserella parasuis]MDG6370791.1 restriction endonuclease subunit S [Glaesserella parasuis]MDG6845016.1 restriction endonuclease subunit S [Glaesserella parasuis]